MSDFVKLVAGETTGKKKRGRPARSYKDELEKMQEASHQASSWTTGALAVYAPLQVSILVWVAGGLLYRALETGSTRDYVQMAVPAALAVALLAITVPHVAAGIKHVTNFGKYNSFLLAVGVDCVAVCLEGLVKVGDLDTFSVVCAVAGWVGSVAFSCRLNYVGFLFKRTQQS